jgi:hypothetical protein
MYTSGGKSTTSEEGGPPSPGQVSQEQRIRERGERKVEVLWAHTFVGIVVLSKQASHRGS